MILQTNKVNHLKELKKLRAISVNLMVLQKLDPPLLKSKKSMGKEVKLLKKQFNIKAKLLKKLIIKKIRKIYNFEIY